MSFRNPFIAITIALAACALAAEPRAGEMRVWTSAEGGMTLEGEFVKLEGGMIEAFMARTGINGIFSIDIDGVRFDLFFHFDEADRLREIALQSSAYERGEYDKSLKGAWERLRGSFVLKFGQPTLSTGFPKASQISEGVSMSSDIWEQEKRPLYLGTGMVEGKVSCVLRSSRDQYIAPEPEGDVDAPPAS